jgi:hypothetical protein
MTTYVAPVRDMLFGKHAYPHAEVMARLQKELAELVSVCALADSLPS